MTTRGSGFPLIPTTLRIVERFRRVGPEAIDYQFTVENPTFYSRAVDGDAADAAERRDDLRVRVPRRQLRIVHVLEGHRAEERRAEEAAKKDRQVNRGDGHFFRRCPYISSSTNSTHLYSRSCAFFSMRRYSGMLIFQGRVNTFGIFDRRLVEQMIRAGPRVALDHV